MEPASVYEVEAPAAVNFHEAVMDGVLCGGEQPDQGTQP